MEIAFSAGAWLLDQAVRFLLRKASQALKTWMLTNTMAPLQLPYLATSALVMILV